MPVYSEHKTHTISGNLPAGKKEFRIPVATDGVVIRAWLEDRLRLYNREPSISGIGKDRFYLYGNQ